MFRKMERWERTLYIVFFAQIVSTIGFACIFPFLPLYVESLGSQSGLSTEFLSGLVFSSQALTMAITSPLWGAVADRFGRKLMVERALFGGVIIVFLMAFVRSAEELIILRTIQGAITGTISAANALVAGSAPRERMGYAMGITQMGLWIGISVGPLIGGIIADTLGYRASFVITAVLLLIAGIMVHLGVHEERNPNAPARRRGGGGLAGWRQIITSPGVGITYSARFLAGLGRTVLIPVAPLFIATLMVNDTYLGTMTGLVVGIASATGTVSAVYLGRLGDRIGHVRILKICAFIGALCYIPQAFVTSAWQLLLLQALSGAAIGGITPALGALLAHYTVPGVEGAVYGLDNSVLSTARAVAPLLGAAIAVTVGLRGVFIITALIFLAVGLLAAWRLPDISADKSAASPTRSREAT